MKPSRVGLIGYDGVQALDLFGPADAFTAAEIETEPGHREPPYEIVILAARKEPFRTEANICCDPHTTLRNAPPLDTLIVPGGKGSRVDRVAVPIADWISARAKQIRR